MTEDFEPAVAADDVDELKNVSALEAMCFAAATATWLNVNVSPEAVVEIAELAKTLFAAIDGADSDDEG